MQKYKCNKEVEAVKVDEITNTSYGCLLLTSDDADNNIPVSRDWVKTNRPAVPGYHVIYPDGYSYWLTTEVFENRYSLISEPEKTVEDNARSEFIELPILRYDEDGEEIERGIAIIKMSSIIGLIQDTVRNCRVIYLAESEIPTPVKMSVLRELFVKNCGIKQLGE